MECGACMGEREMGMKRKGKWERKKRRIDEMRNGKKGVWKGYWNGDNKKENEKRKEE